MEEKMFKIIMLMATGGIIGYFTNWLAIKMLFRPYTQKSIAGVKIPFTPGMIPKDKEKIAKKISHAVGEHLLTNDTIVESLCSNEVNNEIEQIIGNYIYDIKENNDSLELFLTKKFGEEDKEKIVSKVESLILKEINSLLPSGGIMGMMMGGIAPFIEDAVAKKKEEILKRSISEFGNEFNEESETTIKRIVLTQYKNVIEKEADKIISSINLQQLVENNINKFSNEEMEQIVLSVAKKELQAITWLGALIGSLIGLLPIFIKF